jgi:hypothetical protein
MPNLSKSDWPRVLIYKRNHTGDPDAEGVFGCHDCMGQVRAFRYDAVIGIGVNDPWPGCEGIAGRISWVGVAPQRVGIHPYRGAPLIKFRHWKVYDTGGPQLRKFAPHLANYFYERHRRYFFSDGLTSDIQLEIQRIIGMAIREVRRRSLQSPHTSAECLPGSRRRLARC